MNCHNCDGVCNRKGVRNNIQKYQCKSCKKYQQSSYRYKKIDDCMIIKLTKESCGIRGTARILAISPTTVIRRILKISRALKRSQVPIGRTYQVDELFTFIGNKRNRICIAYSLEVKTGNVIDVVVGKRNKTNLKQVISTLLASDAKEITTDKLNIYRELIPTETHSTKFRGINKIERRNLNLRTHLKRLNRRTICFSKSAAMLLAVVKIYFWG